MIESFRLLVLDRPRCDAVQLRKEPEWKGSVQAYRVPAVRGKADGLNRTGHRHYRCAGLPHILW
jgi:hypothetical protein